MEEVLLGMYIGIQILVVCLLSISLYFSFKAKKTNRKSTIFTHSFSTVSNTEIIAKYQEINFLMMLDKSYKYAARDRNGTLYFYKKIPVKKEGVWNVIENYEHNPYFTVPFNIQWFNYVKWEDKYPLNVEELLGEVKCID